MGKVVTGASMSLDGYIAGPEESGFEHLFQWLGNGEVEVPTARPDMTLRMISANAKFWADLMDRTGAIVVGRRLFDLTQGWGGTHPIGCPIVVLTHDPPTGFESGDTPFTFVTEGIEAAVKQARTLAGDKDVTVNAGDLARQCLDARLLEEIWIGLVPVVLGGGVPFFGQLSTAPVELDGPEYVLDAERVTHLGYRIRYS